MKKISIHPFFYLAALITILTGTFRSFIALFFLLFIHECGHILVALFYHWKIEKIIILPFGGLTLFHESLNRYKVEEFWISLAGPLFQIIFYYLWTSLCGYSSLFWNNHITLLLFNLLPIYPLDGSKLLSLGCNCFFPFLKSYTWTLLISFIFLILMSIFIFYFNWNLLLFLVLAFLFLKCVKEFQARKYIWNKFLWERYRDYLVFPKRKKINGIDLTQTYRDRTHLFYQDGKTYTEREILSKRFDNP